MQCQRDARVMHAVRDIVLAARWGAKNVGGRVREQLGPVGPLPHMGCQDPDFGLLCQDPTLLQQEGLASVMFIALLLRDWEIEGIATHSGSERAAKGVFHERRFLGSFC